MILIVFQIARIIVQSVHVEFRRDHNMAHGGKRPGSGRPALLMAVYKDQAHEIELRIDAAKAAVRYEKPALSSMTATLTHKPASALDDDDLKRRITDLDAEIARRSGGDAVAEDRPRKPH